MRESDILYQRGTFWVAKDRGHYIVYRDGDTFATSDSAYAITSDGMSLAKARIDYLFKRNL